MAALLEETKDVRGSACFEKSETELRRHISAIRGWIVNHIIEELLNLDVEPKPESLWWTSTHKEADERQLTVGSGGKIGICRSLTRLISWAIAFAGLGKGFKARTRQARWIHSSCKEYISYYRKLATKTVRIRHEQQLEH